MDRIKKRQTIRKLILLASFSVFPITVIYLAPAPPIMSLRAGVINLSVVVIVSIFLSGFFFRRFFCGWICPGAGCQLVSGALNNKPVERRMTNWVQIIMVVVWVLVLISTFIIYGSASIELGHPGSGRFATSEIRYFLPYIPVVLFMFGFVLLFGRNGFCHRGCWINPIISASTYIGRRLRFPSLHVAVHRHEDCEECSECNQVCPMSIDVRNIIEKRGIFPNNCVQCGACVDFCPEGFLKFRLSSEQFS